MSNNYYFPQKNRSLQLQRLQQFLTDAEPLIMVIGSHGMGKSSLFSQLQHLGQLPVRTCKVMANTGLKPQKLCQILFKQWQIGGLDESLTQEQQLNALISASEQFHKGALLVIDEAQKLPISTLAAIMHLALSQSKQSVRLRIILMGTDKLAEQIQHLHHPDINLPRIDLTPFDRDEAQSYFEYLLDQLGHGTNHIIVPDIANRIYQQSQGIPRKLHHLAMEAFSDLPKNNPQASTEQTTSASMDNFWQRHWIKAACIAMLAFTFTGIHQYQMRINQSEQLALTPSRPVSMTIQAAKPQPVNNKPLPMLASKTYTIQLMGDYGVAPLMAFAKRQHLSQLTHIMHSEYHNKTWYTLNIGNYQTRAEAQAALTHLPAKLLDLKPFIKT